MASDRGPLLPKFGQEQTPIRCHKISLVYIRQIFSNLAYPNTLETLDLPLIGANVKYSYANSIGLF